MRTIPPSETALLIVDLQNDFLHPEGAYGRAGQAAPEIAALPERVLPVAQALRAAEGWIVAAQFTLTTGKGGAPFIAPHLHEMRPFLGQGDFLSGSWGHAIVDDLQPVDIAVEKVAYSAFYMTRLDFMLRKAGIGALIVCGIVTNGGVASTVRDAHVRDLEVTVLSDGCAAFSPETHETAIASLASVARIATCAEVVETLT